MRILVISGLALAGVLIWFAVFSSAGDDDVVVADAADASDEGERLFNADCASCHGVRAEGSDNGPLLVHVIYEPGHHGDEAFHLAALNGARAHHWRFGDMPPIEGVTPDDVAEITAYVRALQRAAGID